MVSILTLSIFTKVLRYAFFGELNEKFKDVKDAPLLMKISMIILAFVALSGGVLMGTNVDNVFLKKAAKTVTDGQRSIIVAAENMRGRGDSEAVR
jgi:formate hydrogenlyase subunit 3/multisubunit Na+/H+ antiporter MnhD subunit